MCNIRQNIQDALNNKYAPGHTKVCSAVPDLDPKTESDALIETLGDGFVLSVALLADFATT